MNYSREAIQHLTELIKGVDTARDWLQTNNFPELILVHYSLEGNETALRELTQKKYVDLVAFVHAVQDDKRAYNWLAENKKFTWAATVRVTYKDNNAEAWLMRNNLSWYADLGRAIRMNEENEQADDIFGLFRKIIQALKPRAIRKKNQLKAFSKKG